VKLEEVTSGVPPTEKLYLDDSYTVECEARVLRFVPETGSSGYVVLDRTVMHPKGGGQPTDTGWLRGEDFEFVVKKVIEVRGVLVHYGRAAKLVRVPDMVKVGLDWDARYMVMRSHTAGHIIDYAFLELLGGGSPTSLSAFHGQLEGFIEFEGEPPKLDLDRLEEIANRVVAMDREVAAIYVERERLLDVVKGAMNLKRLPSMHLYRVVVIEGVNAIPCGGTHVKRTSEVGYIELTGISESPLGFRINYRVSR